jgi:hypothetical protein
MDSWDEKKGNGQLGREKVIESWDEKRNWTAGTKKGNGQLGQEKELTAETRKRNGQLGREKEMVQTETAFTRAGDG